MKENEEFEDVDLEDITLNNILNNQNKLLPKLREMDEKGNELFIVKPKERAEFLLKKKKIIKVDNICDNIYFVLIIYFIQSLISLATFYLYYIYKFAIENIILFIIVELSLFSIFLIFYLLIIYLSKADFQDKHPKFSNYSLFILINIEKNIFETFLYLLITLDKDHDQLDFPHFEARAYWKITMCLFYIMMIFYIYFSKNDFRDTKSEECKDILKWILCACTVYIGDLIFVLFLLFTQYVKNYNDRFYYLFAIHFELTFLLFYIQGSLFKKVSKFCYIRYFAWS